MQLEDWLDDLCVRFILNLPHEELDSVERICFQIEEAQWFYEDFIRPLDPTLPSLPLRNFSLLIFQHCPLFTAWPQEAFSLAFSQFLAYKIRVPVRGAIMLNEEMDHVVLVKGWKKSANWSFPRGKINKDETDLDCAIREVYEETGYDIRAAGLVPDVKDMKYISVTIREQHLGLYVFRGVPMDTHFEPRTRKEISKIEWWKLSDLPTFKKNKHQEGSGESLAVNANKFYMVAPFLNDLKKWITRQRKRDAIEGRHLAARSIREEQAIVTEDEPDLIDLQAPELVPTLPVPSDLPEVSVSPSINKDPSAHLKALLKITSSPAPTIEAPLRDLQTNTIDQEKTAALLSLLRGGQKLGVAQSNVRPYTPQEQVVKPSSVPQSPHPDHTNIRSSSGLPPPPFIPSGVQIHSSTANSSVINQPVSAPYHRTGDPEFARTRKDQHQGPAVPPASSLPQLSKHAQSLLDAFKSQPSAQSTAIPEQLSGDSRDLLLKRPTGFPPRMIPMASFVTPATAKNPSEHQNNLLGLFKQGPLQSTQLPGQFAKVRAAPVELAANPAIIAPKIQSQPQKDLLVQLLQRKASEANVADVNEPPTNATVSELSSRYGPMRQAGSSSIANAELPGPLSIGAKGPQEQKRITILQRKPQETTSYRPVSGSAMNREEQSTPAGISPSPFQPQFLQRPTQQSPRPIESPASTFQSNGRTSYASTAPAQSFDRRTSQPDAHKQSLLSLFGKSSAIDQSEPFRKDSLASNAAPSPASLISPLNISNASIAIDPNLRISPQERSRMGSESSLGGILTPSSTRTTRPDERKFLLDLMTKGHAS